MLIIDVHLECTTGTSNKFWHGQIHLIKTTEGKQKFNFDAVYGRIGTSGTTNTKQFATIYKTYDYLLSKIKEKVKKGYVFKSDSKINEGPVVERNADLRIATSRFLASASALPGWIDFTRARESKKSVGTDKPMDMPSPKPTQPKVTRKPLIII